LFRNSRFISEQTPSTSGACAKGGGALHNDSIDPMPGVRFNV